MIVVDASAVVAYLENVPLGSGEIARQRFTGDELHVPHLLDVGVPHALRSLLLRGVLSPKRAGDAIENLPELPVIRYPHYPLAPRVWALRHNLTAYDATYVALAEELQAPLITLDRGMRDAPGHGALVEVL